MPSVPANLLSRTSHHRPQTARLRIMPEVELDLARAHEICGPARRTLALALAQATQGPILWIKPEWMPDSLNPDGLQRFVDPSRFLFVSARRAEDILWTMEESLRAGQIALTFAEVPGLPGLTAIRRLHLAAETGAAEGPLSPLGVLLTPGDGGAPGVETRWFCAPAHGSGGQEVWRLERRRARTAPPKSWQMDWSGKALRLGPAAQAASSNASGPGSSRMGI